MRTRIILVAAMIAIAATATTGWWLMSPPSAPQPEGTAEGTGRILYYRDPSGAPFFSLAPKKNAQGVDYVAIRALEPGATRAHAEGRKVLYYRNPMGLPDTSPVPKKDNMGMDYVAVYADEAQPQSGAPGAVRLSLDRVQRLGVRTTAVTKRRVFETVRVTGTVAADERKLTVVTLKFTAWIDKLYVAATGDLVHAGQPLFRINSPFLLQEETNLALALSAESVAASSNAVFARANDRAMQATKSRLVLYAVPDAEVRRLLRTQKPSGKFDWLAPANGVVIEKPVIVGQRAEAGEVLYRIADLSTIWVVADVPELLLGGFGLGAEATIKLKAYPGRNFTGKIAFIYPDVSMTTRTVKVRIELANRETTLMPGMYADVEIAPASEEMVLAVPESAVIDTGSRQIALVSRGEGLFEPRNITVGRHGGGFVEIREGLKDGESVVTSATFLIDAESNLRAALQAFVAGGDQPQ